MCLIMNEQLFFDKKSGIFALLLVGVKIRKYPN